MKSVFKILPIVTAVAALSFSVSSFAGGNNNGEDNHNNGDDNKNSDTTDLHFKKNLDLSVDYKVNGTAHVNGDITVNQNAMAISDTNQNLSDIKIDNKGSTKEDAKIDKNSFNNANGNIGVNVGSGQGFEQANSLSMAIIPVKAGASTAVDAEAFTNQTMNLGKHEKSSVKNHGSNNYSSVHDNAFQHTTGVIGVNVGSGQLFEQSNSLVIGDGSIVLGTATSKTVQNLNDLKIDNKELENSYCNYNTPVSNDCASISDYAFANASGNISVNVGAGQGFAQSNSTAVAN
jgi:hypothetical protein